MQTYTFAYPVTFADIDSGYNLTPNAILCYFQDAIARFLTLGGAGPKDIRDKGLLWMITEFHTQIEDTRPVWPDTVKVTVWFSEISMLKTHVDYFMQGPSGQRFAAGTSTWLIMDRNAGRPFRCSELPELLALHDEKDATHSPKFLFTEIGDTIREMSHTVSASDIDFNGHVSNQIYVRLATSMASSEYGRTHRMRQMHVKFERECFLGDELTISLKRSSDGEFSTLISRPGSGETVCRINSSWTEA